VPREELPFRSGLEPAIVFADSDPTGATTDGDPLNQPYFGVAYANGLRDNRMRALIGGSTTSIDRDAALAIQQDTQSTLAAHVKDEIVRQLDLALPSLTGAQRMAVMLARDVLAQWTLDTPQGAVAADANSGATLFFATWMHDFIRAAVGDELMAAGYTHALADDRAARIVYRLLIAPGTLAQHPTTNEPLLCGATGCQALIVQAAVSAIATLTADGSGRDDWRWGRRHAARFRTLFPDPSGALLLPTAAEDMTGLQLAGDMFSVDRTDGGWADLDFTPQTTIAYRMQLVGSPFGLHLLMRLVLPTGTVLDTRDPHYRDLQETSYLSRTAFDVHQGINAINDFGESRWELR
jgi:acyl-homoserine lactone acylase PvdQ